MIGGQSSARKSPSYVRRSRSRTRTDTYRRHATSVGPRRSNATAYVQYAGTRSTYPEYRSGLTFCSPCAKRADRGVPFEYTSETRTGHGPSKGYVHHLESKLRELQNSATPDHEVPADRPQLFSAINRPRQLESAWSTTPPALVADQNRQPFGYNVSDSRSSRAPSTYTPQETNQPHFGSSLGAYLTTAPGHSSTPFLERSTRAIPSDVVPTPGNSITSRILTASALRGSMGAPSPPVPSGAPSRPLLFNRVESRMHDGVSPQVPRSPRLGAHISNSPAPRPAYFSSGRSASFVRQIRSAIDSRFQNTHPPPGSAAAGSPSAQPRKMEPMAHPPSQSVDYVLPSRKTADNLFRIYWDTVYPLMPFLNRGQFEEAYAGIWSGSPTESDESLMMCTLNVVFALASQYSERVIPRERETSAGKFFDRAQDLLNLDLWGVGSVELVQCLLLMGQYLQSINSLHQCWTVGGLATRVADGLGLHLPETSAKLPDIRQREHLRRLWHGCILLDR